LGIPVSGKQKQM